MNNRTYSALRRLLDYVMEDERKSWEEAGEPPIGHIYLDILALDDWAQEVAKDY